MLGELKAKGPQGGCRGGVHLHEDNRFAITDANSFSLSLALSRAPSLSLSCILALSLSLSLSFSLSLSLSLSFSLSGFVQKYLTSILPTPPGPLNPGSGTDVGATPET